MHHRRLVFLLCLLPFTSFSQSNFKEATLLTSTGDTLRGFVDYRNWFHNPETIQFKNALPNETAQQYTPDNAAFISVPGFATYKAFTVSISMNEVDFGSLSVESDTTNILKTVFLKQLLHGDRVSMYSYRDKIKERFYVVKNDEQIAKELLYSKTVRNLQEFKNETYKQQLRSLAIETNILTEELDGNIQSSEYVQGDLKKLLTKFNSKIEAPKSQQVQSKRRMGYFVNVGINRWKIKYSGESLVTVDRLNSNGMDKFKDEVMTQSWMPIISGGADVYLNRETKRLIARFEVFASGMKSSTTSYTKLNEITPAESENTYKFSALNVSLTPQLLYNFYRNNSINCYIGAGASFNILRVQENVLEQKPINHSNTNPWKDDSYFFFKTSYLSAVLRCGLQYRDRIDCSFLWGNSPEYTNTVTNGGSVKTGLFALSVGYLFNRGEK